jgi:protein AbiQ
MDQPSNLEFEYMHLTTDFYSDYAHCEQMMRDENRQYLHLLIKHRGNDFFIPFRSNVNHPFAFIFSQYVPSNEAKIAQKGKGIDYSKAVIINDIAKYASSSSKPIPQVQHDAISKHFSMIRNQFCKFVNNYCNDIQKGNTSALERKRSHMWTLQYFHKELGILEKESN